MSQSIFLLQTTTLTKTLGGSGYLESDWMFSGALAWHQLTKHPENNQSVNHSFWGRREEPMAWHRAGRCVTCTTCPLSLTALVAKARGQSVLLEIPLEWWHIWIVQHLDFLHPSLYLSSYLSSLPCLSSSYFLSSYDQPEGNLSWPPSKPPAWKQRSEKRNTPCTRENTQSQCSGEKGNMEFHRASFLFLSDKASLGQQIASKAFLKGKITFCQMYFLGVIIHCVMGQRTGSSSACFLSSSSRIILLIWGRFSA